MTICELHAAEYDFWVLDNAYITHDGFKENHFPRVGRINADAKRTAFLHRSFRFKLSRKYIHSSRNMADIESAYSKIFVGSSSGHGWGS
ncbi:unnamed protein product [Darwinula stevensoni]|uniref:Uncharacterized protein n=1 Tax=Darwinula stevensoni TaxID=69355 RepID=A0A7R8XBD0_9CRUS|nr:unnamed protein product [Darwinula stevensoni]CAG0887658.1 unnamed protein product [Darwinula stevensoni]